MKKHQFATLFLLAVLIPGNVSSEDYEPDGDGDIILSDMPISTTGEEMIVSALRAAKERDWQTVQVALIGIPQNEIDKVNNGKRNLMHYAAISGDIEILSELVKKGFTKASLNVKDKYGKYPYQYSLKNSKLTDPYRMTLMDMKTEKQYKLSETLRRNGHEVTLVKKHLLDGANPDVSVPFHPYNGYSPFLLAVRYGFPDTAQLFVDYGADINVQAPDGVTFPMLEVYGPRPLHYNWLKKCKVLEATDDHGRNLLFYAVLSDAKPQNVIWAASVIKDINKKDNNGNTALAHACKRGKSLAIGFLYFLEADFSIKNNDGETCYDMAGKESIDNAIFEAKKWLEKNNIPTDRQGMIDKYCKIVYSQQ